MKINTKIGHLTFLYVGLLLAAIPIIRYILAFKLDIWGNDVEDILVWERVFLSGPLCIIFGSYIYLRYKSPHKLIGLISAILGVLWVLALIRTIVEEAA